MNGIKYLVGSEDIIYGSIKTFANETCDFLSDLSNALLTNAAARSFSDIVSFAFFCRRANIARIKERYADELRFGRGMAFHIAPSNVPINFAFSFVFGLLSGNSNIVRVSSKPFPQVEIVCDEIKRTIEKYPNLKKRNSIISYPADDNISGRLSEAADVRIIWGGDDTIGKFKKLDVKTKSVDIAFADRYSVGLIDGNAVLNADDLSIEKLAESFYNDTYFMDQNACSSPHIIFWLNGNENAKQRFWDAVSQYAEKRYVLEAEKAVNKYLQLCRNIINSDTPLSYSRPNNILYRESIDSLPDDIINLRGVCGYFYEHDITELENINQYITPKFQTLCYFGISKDILREWVNNNALHGIDRIVPFGKSMDITEIWDGYDIIRFGSRVISII